MTEEIAVTAIVLGVRPCLAGLVRLPLQRIERYAIAGAAVALCGAATHLGL
jgi:hypothetical protein